MIVSEGRRVIPHEDETDTAELRKAALDQYSVVRNEAWNNSHEVAARACAGMDLPPWNSVKPNARISNIKSRKFAP